MKNRTGFTLLIIAFMSPFLLYTCESEAECGCDGKKAFSLNYELGEIYYETESDYATFVSQVMYTRFTLCNPGEFRDTLATFEQGAIVYVSGTAHYECYNNPYAPTSFFLTMKNIVEYKVDD